MIGASLNFSLNNEISNRLQMLEMRAQAAEALLHHVFTTLLRTADPKAIIAAYEEHIAAMEDPEVLDPTLKGRR